MKWYFALLLLLCSSTGSAQEIKQLWLYSPGNLQVDETVDRFEKLWKRAADAGYTHIMLADSKFARLGDLGENTKRYFRNVERVKKLAKDLKLEIVPCLFNIGYSNNMLWHDPNLAEGLPVKGAPFVVKNGNLVPANDPRITLGKFSKDDIIEVKDGIATVRDNPSNARLMFKLTVPKFRAYHVSVKVKTDQFTGEPRIAAIGNGQSLQWETIDVKKTQDWTEHHVVFNTLDHEAVTVYFGQWGKARGTLQWKDWKIEEAGLVNVLRRPGCPVTIEGKGVEPDSIVDPKMGRIPWKGEFISWHEPPTIRTTAAEGSQVRISYYHPAIIYRGQVMICLEAPKTFELLKDEAKRIREAFGAQGYMMGFDEIRTLGWDESCAKSDRTPGQMLAKAVRDCERILKGSTIYTWSDMFDPHHNAKEKGYYLVNGSLSGSWEGLSPSTVIVNWNAGHREESLKFFSERGHSQIIAAYYDGPIKDSEAWKTSASKVKGVIGMMYTTWENDYSKLEEFAAMVKDQR